MDCDSPEMKPVNLEPNLDFLSHHIPEIAMNFDDFDYDTLMASPLAEPCESRTESKNENPAEDDNPDIFREAMPENVTNIDEVEATVAKQMMALSVEDREKVYMEVHGVKEGPHETEENIQAGLESMQIEIEKLQDKEAYELAQKMDPKYVEARFLRLAFLRSEYYDPKRAALKLIRHFQLKLHLFGKEKLTLDITQDDLDRDTIEALYSGRGQFLNARDSAGRYFLILFFGDIFSAKAKLQRAFYQTMVAMRNPDVQIHGLVVFVFALGHSFSPERDTPKHWKFSKVTDALPMRMEAIHLCHNSLISQVLFAVVKAAASPFLRIRMRTHYGAYNEIVSDLAQYGVTPGTIPVTEGFKVTNLEAFEEHLRDLRSEERMKQPRRQKISVPSRSDVLFGKGAPFQTHRGNMELRSLVSQFFKAYEKAVKGEKNRIAQEIVETMQQKSGMFLRPDGDSWICVDDEVARQKVSNLFRTLRVKVGKK